MRMPAKKRSLLVPTEICSPIQPSGLVRVGRMRAGMVLGRKAFSFPPTARANFGASTNLVLAPHTHTSTSVKSRRARKNGGGPLRTQASGARCHADENANAAPEAQRHVALELVEWELLLLRGPLLLLCGVLLLAHHDCAALGVHQEALAQPARCVRDDSERHCVHLRLVHGRP